MTQEEIVAAWLTKRPYYTLSLALEIVTCSINSGIPFCADCTDFHYDSADYQRRLTAV